MKHPPSQSEVDLELSKQFIDGDFKDLGDELDRDRSLISKLYSPNDRDHKNPFYTALRHLYHMKNVRYELALGIYKTFDFFARRILFNGEKGTTVGLKDQTFRNSLFKLIGAEIDRLPNVQKLKAVQDARLELEKYERGLMHEDMDSEVEQVSNAAS